MPKMFEKQLRKINKSIEMQTSLFIGLLILIILFIVIVPFLAALFLDGIAYLVTAGLYSCFLVAAGLFAALRFFKGVEEINEGINVFLSDDSFRFQNENSIFKTSYETKATLNCLFNKIASVESHDAELAHNIAGEVLNPLSAMIMTLESLSNGCLESGSETVSVLKKDAKRIESAVDVISCYSYVSSSGKVICRVSDLVSQAYERAKNSESLSDLDFSFRVKEHSSADFLVNVNPNRFSTLLDLIVHRLDDVVQKTTMIEFSFSEITRPDNDSPQIKISIADDRTDVSKTETLSPAMKKIAEAENAQLEIKTTAIAGCVFNVILPLYDQESADQRSVFNV